MEKEIGDINVDVNKNINESDGGGDRDDVTMTTLPDTDGLNGWPPLTVWLTGLILGLVVFVIILPACCTAIYHYVSYKKGWDDDEDLECDSACSECNVQMDRQESDEEIQFRQRERWRYYYRMLSAAKIAQTASGIAGIAGIEVAAPTRAPTAPMAAPPRPPRAATTTTTRAPAPSANNIECKHSSSSSASSMLPAPLFL